MGVILAGGRGLRLGGVDKALLRLGDETLIERAVRRLHPQVAALAIAVGGDGSEQTGRFFRLGADVRCLPNLPDAVVGGVSAGTIGPLAGILAALGWARAMGARHLVSAAVDTPFFPADLAARLAAASGGGPAFATGPGGPHPVFALWPVGLEPALRRYLAQGGRRVGVILDRHAAVPVAFASAAGDPFLNINRPEDLTAAQARL